MENFDVYIYTDGACRGNPGPGGYGIIMEWVGKKYIKEFSEGYLKTTNNRMELLAIIVALQKLKKTGLKVKVFSDSKYVIDAVQKKWVFGWQKKGFKGKKNSDLWIQFLEENRKHNVFFEWVKGHNNHPQNERCDTLAVLASKKEKLLPDHGFDTENSLFD